MLTPQSTFCTVAPSPHHRSGSRCPGPRCSKAVYDPTVLHLLYVLQYRHIFIGKTKHQTCRRLHSMRECILSSAVARALFPRLGGAAPVHCVAAGDTGRPDPALSRAACATRRRAGGLLRVRRRRRLPPLFEPELLRFRQQLPYRRPLGCKLPVMGTRAAGGYVGMSEGWLGTVCALFLRSFNAATPLLKYIEGCWSCAPAGRYGTQVCCGCGG